MDIFTLLGFTAAIFTTSAYFPQAWKTIKTRETKDLSLITYIVLVAGVVLWLLYGITQQDWPLIVANAISLIVVGSILILKLKHG